MKLLAIAGIALLCAFIPGCSHAPHRRPNVVIIISDDQRLDTIHALGNEHIQTPAQDRLVREGVTFTRAYCRGSDSGAVCAPSRAMLLTGRPYLQIEPGFRVPWSGPAESRGETNHAILPRVLRDAGYDTFATGKWHQGRPSFAECFTHGDAIFFGGMGSHTELPVHAFDPSGEYPQSRARPLSKFSSEAFADAFVGFVDERPTDERPYMAWVSFTAPHDPRTPPADVRARYREDQLPLPANFLSEHPFDNGELVIRDEQLAPTPRTPERVRKEIADYYAMITHMDAQIGRILDAIDRSGQPTIVAFVSDHGLAIGSHGLLGKQNLYEHSMGAVFILRGKNVPANQTRDDLVYLHDLGPTICELTQIDTPDSFTSRSLVPATRDESRRARRDHVVLGYRDVQRAIVGERWKLIAYPKIDRVQLFDLQSDPDEMHDLSGDQPERVRTMLHALVRSLAQDSDQAGAAAVEAMATR